MVANRITMVPRHSRVLTGHQHPPTVKDLHHNKLLTIRAILRNTSSNRTNTLHKINTHRSNLPTAANHHTPPRRTQTIVVSPHILPKVNNKAPTRPALKALSDQTAREGSAQL